MGELRTEINETLDIFDSYQIPEERQRELITSGIHFTFTYGGPDPNHINRRFDCFKFARMLKFCQDAKYDLDVEAMLRSPWDDKYQKLVHFFDSMDREVQRKEVQSQK